MAAITEMVVVLPAIYVMNQIDWTKSENLLYVRIAYGTVQVLAITLWLVLYKMISDKNNTKKIRVPPPSIGSGVEQEMTICEYDISNVKKALNQLGLGLLVVLGIHLKWDIIQPLFIQTLMVPLQLYKNPLVKIYILGQKGEVETRPFKEENPFAAFLPQPPAAPVQEIPAQETPVVDSDDDAPRVQELPDDHDVTKEEVISNKKDKDTASKRSSRTKRDNY